MIRKVRDQVEIDEKYSILLYEDNKLEIHRYGMPWLVNPEGSKAWVAVLYRLLSIEGGTPAQAGDKELIRGLLDAAH